LSYKKTKARLMVKLAGLALIIFSTLISDPKFSQSLRKELKDAEASADISTYGTTREAQRWN
jgi:hypothetical protein